MHLIFIPYGIKDAVARLEGELFNQKFQLPVYKGDKKELIWMNGNLRLLPFGVWDYVFPKEYLDMVMTSLAINHEGDRYNLGKIRFAMLRNFCKAKPIPKDYDKSKAFIWVKNNVEILPIGIREDVEVEEKEGQFKGWKHEAI